MSLTCLMAEKIAASITFDFFSSADGAMSPEIEICDALDILHRELINRVETLVAVHVALATKCCGGTVGLSHVCRFGLRHYFV